MKIIVKQFDYEGFRIALDTYGEEVKSEHFRTVYKGEVLETISNFWGTFFLVLCDDNKFRKFHISECTFDDGNRQIDKSKIDAGDGPTLTNH